MNCSDSSAYSTMQKRGNIPTLYLVIPCYNEEAALPITADKLRKKLENLIFSDTISENSKILLVNDGSKDNTWNLIKQYQLEYKYFAGVNLSRNFGHQHALLAGLLTAKDYADAVISMDADLQDDINAIDEMIERYKEGFDIVYGVRSKREKDTFFKKFTAESYYRMLALWGAKLIFNHADYRLMSRRALNTLAEFKEVNLFIRGLVPMVGYPSTQVYYERGERVAGESKYPLKKMLSFAMDGITSLSVKPIQAITKTGIIVFAFSIMMVVYSVVQWFTGHVVTGWASIICSIWTLGGLLLIAVGIVGEYIGKIYLETKHRPVFIIADTVGVEEKLDEEV